MVSSGICLLDVLHSDLLSLILSHCTPTSAIGLSATCRSFRSALDASTCRRVIKRAWHRRFLHHKLLADRRASGQNRDDDVFDWRRSLIVSANDLRDLSTNEFQRSLHYDVDFKIFCVVHDMSDAVKALLVLLFVSDEVLDQCLVEVVGDVGEGSGRVAEATFAKLTSFDLFSVLSTAHAAEPSEHDRDVLVNFLHTQERARFMDGASGSDVEWGLFRWMHIVRAQKDDEMLVECVERANRFFARDVVARYADHRSGERSSYAARRFSSESHACM